MTDESAFAPGQVWTYRDASPATSRVVVGDVDRIGPVASAFTVISISVTGVRLVHPGTGEVRQEDVYHCPIQAETLAGCVIARDGVGQTADGYDDGYLNRREAYEAGDGGFFTIPVAEIVDLYRNLIGGAPH